MADMISLKRSEDGLLSDGLYRLKIEEVTMGNGKSGYPYMNIQYTVIVNGKPRGGSLLDIVSQSPKAAFKMNEFLDAIGAPDSDEEVPLRWFKNKYLYAYLTKQTYESKGKIRTKNAVDAYVTKEIAEQQLSQEDDDDEDDDDTAPVAQPARSKATTMAGKATRPDKQRAAVAEMQDDDFPL